jgi:hypothetical protein
MYLYEFSSGTWNILLRRALGERFKEIQFHFVISLNKKNLFSAALIYPLIV